MESDLTKDLDEEEQLMRRHRKEKKELQAKIQGMKNAQLTEDVAKLEKEMEQKHKEELEQLRLTCKENKIDSVAVNISNLALENRPPRISKYLLIVYHVPGKRQCMRKSNKYLGTYNVIITLEFLLHYNFYEEILCL
uniref:Uncharacterized protein n=1 Tax=Urocitellus parryii TaxID=9999 RepID=A0A8D2KJN1_UROPR